MKHSKWLSLNSNDFVKGAVLTVITAVLTSVMQMLTNVPPSIDFKQIGIVSIIAFLGYILKQITTNSSGDLLKKDEDTGGGAVIPDKGFKQ